MEGLIKTNAKDYLLEHIDKSKPKWYNLTVQEVIDANGILDEIDRKKILGTMLIEEGIIKKEFSFDKLIHEDGDSKNIKDNKELIIKKLTHKKGVNALIEEQSLFFNPKCTLIFGLNGTGKSGYFRIFNELTGGKKNKEIISNIFSDDEDLSVEVEYSLNGNIEPTYEWKDKNNRGIYPFTKISVFNSDYLPLYLEERENTVNIEPLGLHLFPAIAKIMDELKSNISTMLNKEKLRIPDLQPLIEMVNSSEIIEILEKENITFKDEEILLKNNIFKDSDEKLLSDLKKKKDDLSSKELKLKIKLTQQYQEDFQRLKSEINTLKNTFIEFHQKAQQLMDEYHKRLKVRDNRKKEFKILKEIPGKDSEEWESFIKSGEDYKDLLFKKGTKIDDTCIYCRQKYDDTSLKIINSYVEYIDDKSQHQLLETEENIRRLINKIYEVTTIFSVTEKLKKTLEKRKIKNNTLYDIISDSYIALKNEKILLLESLKQKEKISKKFHLKISTINNKLSKMIESKDKVIEEYSKSEVEKQEILNNIDSKIFLLNDRKNITKWKEKIQKYIMLNNEIRKLEKIEKSINTRSITDLRSKAQEELITEKLRSSFEEELSNLIENLSVSLTKIKARKAHVRTMLKISGYDVKNILSEGEQKAVGLALFIAELRIRSDKSPIVFDDPVNSLDHVLRGKFAERLARLSKNHQLMIFTHDLLFASQLVKCCADAGRDISTHVIDRPSFGIGRVNNNESPKMANLNNLKLKYSRAIEKYETMSFEEQERAIANAFDYLRCSCECLIEERLFAGTIQRYDDQIKVQNLQEVIFEDSLAKEIVDLHGDISEKAMMHNKSDFNSQNHIGIINFEDCRNKFEALDKKSKDLLKEKKKKRKEYRKKEKETLQEKWK